MNQLFHRLNVRKSHRSKTTTSDRLAAVDEIRVNKNSNMIKTSSRNVVATKTNGNGTHASSGTIIGGNAAKGKVAHIHVKFASSKQKHRPWKKTKSTPHSCYEDAECRARDYSVTEQDSVSRNESSRGTSNGLRTTSLRVSTASETVQSPAAEKSYVGGTPNQVRTTPVTRITLSNGSNRTSATRSTILSSPESHASIASINSSPSLNSVISGSGSSSSDSHCTITETRKVTRSARNECRDDARCFEIDYRGHFVVATQVDEHHMDAVVQMALQASQKALLCGNASMSSVTPSTKSVTTTPNVTKKQRKERESASERLDETGNELFEEGKLDQAFEMYEESLRLKRQALLGQYNALQHQQTCGASSSHISNEERSRILVSMATSINNLTYLRQVRGNMSAQETLEAYEMALYIKRECLGPDHISVGKTLSNIGSVYYLKQDFHEAAAFYEQARDILILHLGADHLDVSTVTSNLGDVHCSMKQWQRAVTEYRAALELRWKLLGPQDSKTVRLMEQIAELEMEIDRIRNKRNSREGNDGHSDKSSAIDRSKRYYRPVLTDLRKLQKELREDLESFSMLERQWPIDMIKDKASLYRELRELKGDADSNASDDEGQLDMLLGSDDSTHDNSFHAALTTLLGDDSALIHEISGKKELGDSTVVSGVVPLSFTVAQEKDVSVRCHVNDVLSARFSQAELLKPRDAVLAATPSPLSPARSVAQMNDDSSFPRLSPDQRRKALRDVRERLAKLRAGREPISESNLPSLPLHADSVRSAPGAPPCFLVKTSDLLTMKQGIDALRTMPNQARPAKESRPRRHIQQKPRPPTSRRIDKIIAQDALQHQNELKSPRRLSFSRCTSLIQ